MRLFHTGREERTQLNYPARADTKSITGGSFPGRLCLLGLGDWMRIMRSSYKVCAPTLAPNKRRRRLLFMIFIRMLFLGVCFISPISQRRASFVHTAPSFFAANEREMGRLAANYAPHGEARRLTALELASRWPRVQKRRRTR